MDTFLLDDIATMMMMMNDEDPEMQCWHSITHRHDLCLLNAWGSQDSHTSIGPRGHTSMVDFVAVRKGHADQAAKQCWRVFARPIHVGSQLDMERFARESSDRSGNFPMLRARIQDHTHLLHGWDLQSVLQAALLKFYAASPLHVVRSGQDRSALTRRTWLLWSMLCNAGGGIFQVCFVLGLSCLVSGGVSSESM